MTDHTITPPPELVEKWDEEGTEMFHPAYQIHLTTRAAQWGADQELEACCELLKQKGVPAWSLLRSHRRPKPPSLKQAALGQIKEVRIDPEGGITYTGLELIRRALEALPDD